MAGPRAGTNDPRELPAYTISEAAHYLAVPAATLRYWSVGRGDYKPLIEVPERAPTLLSFLNLTELHVLAAIRREHEVKMPSIRRAIQYLAAHARQAMDKRHPLISRGLETDGLDLFAEQYGQLINISRAGQTAMREIISARRSAGLIATPLASRSSSIHLPGPPWIWEGRPRWSSSTPGSPPDVPSSTAPDSLPGSSPNATRRANPSATWRRTTSGGMRKSKKRSGASSKPRPEPTALPRSQPRKAHHREWASLGGNGG